MPKQLLAKGLKYGELLLNQHLLDTETAAKVIFKGRILRNWCRFFRVNDPHLFLIHLQIACLFHDIGKANVEFDALVRGNKRFQQTLRHEWLSALILHLPSVRSWLEKSELDLEVITAAVLCHHLQASRQDWGKPRTLEQDKEIELYLQHPEVVRILEKIAELAQIESLPELPEKWVASGAWKEAYDNAKSIGAKFSREIRRNETRRSLLLAVKAGLIAADSVASGIFRIEDSEAITQWVKDTLHREPITREEIEEKILQPRYDDIEKKLGQSFKLKPFQEKATELSSRLLLLSGCGTGKTIFAYKWMQGVLENHQAGHVIFLYPTRGTATEGFKDYVSWAPESEASLLTGTALYELKGMRENPSESTQDKDYTTDERLYALGFWSKRFFSATVDQFLSFLTHSYSGICLLPILADSVVVIDEVHSFDRGMFNNLVSFLENFDIPVLCMTATLPTTRRKDLTDKLENKGKGLGLDIFPTENRSQLEELEKAETRPRYIIQSISYETAYDRAMEAYREGKRVLWVVNTVDRCRQTASQLEDDLKVEVLTYHSRFRLKDRQERHSETVSAFQGKGEAAIAVTTQVCEMSLDLDADVLITELAPISSLVQRFGRSNRSHKRKEEERAHIWVYEPEKVLPYKEEELAKAKEFITDISSFSEISQRTLAEKLEHYSPKEDSADGSSGFVTGGYWATSEPFRDIDDYSVSAILDSDLEEFLKLKEAKNPEVEGLVISIPKKSAYEPKTRPENLPRYLKLADHTKYSEKRGFGE